jgi:hypothetical protein
MERQQQGQQQQELHSISNLQVDRWLPNEPAVGLKKADVAESQHANCTVHVAMAASSHMRARTWQTHWLQLQGRKPAAYAISGMHAALQTDWLYG